MLTTWAHPSEQKFGGPKKRMEMEIPLKVSYFLTHKVIVESNKKDLKEQIYAPGKACKVGCSKIESKSGIKNGVI